MLTEMYGSWIKLGEAYLNAYNPRKEAGKMQNPKTSSKASAG